MKNWLRNHLKRKTFPKKPLLSDDRLDISQREALEKELVLKSSLEDNLSILKSIAGPSPDFSVRNIKVGREQMKTAILHLDELSDSRKVERLIHSLCFDLLLTEASMTEKKNICTFFMERLLSVGTIRESRKISEIWDALASGYTTILFEGIDKALLCNTQGFEKRAIEEPPSETVIRGPREGFIDSIGTNISLLRRKVKTPNLWFEQYTLGSLTHTRVAIVYIKGLASEELIQEVRQRVSRIDTDGIMESGYIEEFIEDQPFTVFPLVFRTERPDRVAASLKEGRIAIITDGTPFVLIVPMDNHMLLQAPDDYYEKVPIGSFLRLVRLFAFWISILLPGTYVAVITFHHELIPTQLLLKIASSREGVPFPVVVEVFIMELVFEFLREAGIRLPRAIGPAISIVGALVLGDAAVRAGIVSPIVVMVVSFTAIASFTTPAFSLGIAARLLRFAFIILGGILGLFGIQFGFLALLAHMVSLRSFGLPYMLSAAPMVLSNWKDLYIRTWHWSSIKRPTLTGYREPVRMKQGQMPRPEIEPEEVEKGPKRGGSRRPAKK